MRSKAMAATAVGWLILFAAGAACHILSFGSARDPNNYETWRDFQLSIYLMVMVPLAVPPLILALAVEYWMLGPTAGPATDVPPHR